METIYDNKENESIPDASSSYRKGWRVMGTYFMELLVIGIVFSILKAPMGAMQIWDGGFEWYMVPLILFGMLYGLFVAGPIGYGTSWVFLKAVRGERVEIRDMFSVFQRNYWNAVIANVVVAVIVGLGMVMLIVPGIIFACRLAFVPYLVVDREMDVMEALRVSWNMTRGYGGHIFFMGLMAFFIAIGGLLLFFVGIFISIMWIKSSFAALYYAVEQRDGIPEYNYPGV
jgi:uncharacterized membrane protein